MFFFSKTSYAPWIPTENRSSVVSPLSLVTVLPGSIGKREASLRRPYSAATTTRAYEPIGRVSPPTVGLCQDVWRPRRHCCLGRASSSSRRLGASKRNGPRCGGPPRAGGDGTRRREACSGPVGAQLLRQEAGTGRWSLLRRRSAGSPRVPDPGSGPRGPDRAGQPWARHVCLFGKRPSDRGGPWF